MNTFRCHKSYYEKFTKNGKYIDSQLLSSIVRSIIKFDKIKPITKVDTIFIDFFKTPDDVVYFYSEEDPFDEIMIVKSDGSYIRFMYDESFWRLRYDDATIDSVEEISMQPASNVEDMMVEVMKILFRCELSFVKSHIKCPECKENALESDKDNMFFLCKGCNLVGTSFNIGTECFNEVIL